MRIAVIVLAAGTGTPTPDSDRAAACTVIIAGNGATVVEDVSY